MATVAAPGPVAEPTAAAKSSHYSSTAALFHFGTDLPSLGPIVSPAPQPTRLVCTSTDELVIANGKYMYVYDVRGGEILSQARLPDDGNVSKMSFATPYLVGSLGVPNSSASAGSFQSVCAYDGRAYAVDSFGSVHSASKSSSGDWSRHSVIEGSNSESYSGGWAGIAAISPSQVSTCHYLTKALSWIDLESAKVTRSSQFSSNPTALSALSLSGGDGKISGQVVAAEGNSVSAWDARMQENAGCCMRMNGGRGQLWTVMSSGDHTVMAAGSDRIVEVYDTRMWRLTLKWRTQCKYDAVHILPASYTNRNRAVYVCGLDNEILLCDVNIPEGNKKAQKRKAEDSAAADGTDGAEITSGPTHAPLPDSSKLRLSHHRGVRAQNCWSGVAVNPRIDARTGTGNDRIYGICDMGKLYVVDYAQRMKFTE